MKPPKFQLLDTVALVRDLPRRGLRKGDLGAVVEVHGPDSFEVEFVTAGGRTRALLTLSDRELRAVGDTDVPAVRRVGRKSA